MTIDRGHIPEMSPKCHPELAGVGIEYSWGKSKWWFRRKSDHTAKHLRANIRESFRKNLGLARVRRFARKARGYRRAYAGDWSMDREDIEKHIKKQRSHRACTQDTAWLLKA